MIEPHVEVYDVEKVNTNQYGSAGKVCLIGAFPSSTFQLGVFTNLDEAKDSVKGEYKVPGDNSVTNANKTVVPTTYEAFYCLDEIFMNNTQTLGAESVLLVNTNYDKQTLSTAMTNSDIASAFLLITDEDIDILCFAEAFSLAGQEGAINTVWATIKAFIDSQFQSQRPMGLITAVDLTSSTLAQVQSLKTLFEDKGVYKLVTTKIRLNGEAESLSLAQSGCWHAAFTSGRAVNLSETGKTYDGVIGESTKDNLPLGTTPYSYKDLMDNGFLTTKYGNRRLSTIKCLNNLTPAGYDMKIERVKNYIVKRLTLEDILGMDNVATTRDYIKGLFEYEKQLAMNNNYLTDMEYEITSVDSETVEALLKLYISDIVRVVVLKVELNITEEA